MRLAVRIFLSSSLVILVVVGVATWSLVAVARIVSVNREITTRNVPALAVEVSLRESVVRATRLEMQNLVRQDPAYEALWKQRAEQIESDLAELGRLLTTEEERLRAGDAVLAFGEYRAAVARELAAAARGEPQRMQEAAQAEARAAATRMEAGLGRLIEATQSALHRARTETRALERRTWITVIVALGAAIMAALAGSAVIAVRMTRSLRRLSAATTSVAEGSFREPLDIRSEDEIGDLARAFNRMATRLRELDALKEQFYATISHELRSPLTSVREAAHLLRTDAQGPLTPKQTRLVSIIHSSAGRLLRLVNQVLDLSRLSAGLLPLDRRWFPVEDAVDRAIEELRVQAEEGEITLARECGPGSLLMFGDEDRIVQVLVNLISNALRFTPSGGTVTLRLVDVGPEIECHVEDTGVGIRPDTLPLLFERFRQAHAGRGGTGLGLAIVRAIVDAHGGNVTAESQEGKGSRFTVVLPKQGAE
jgi:two-component system, NtrC family, sensor histidine kinase GlrK